MLDLEQAAGGVESKALGLFGKVAVALGSG